MKKLFILPALFAFAFSQNVNNQISYTIYTDTKSYPDVTLLSVQGKGLIVNEKNGTRKYNIYIPYINRIKIIEGGSNPIAKPLGCIFGLSLGALGGGLIGFGLYFQSSSYRRTNSYGSGYAGLIVPVAMSGGTVIGAWQGYKLGKNIFKQRYKAVEFERWSLDEKINYLKSIANQ